MKWVYRVVLGVIVAVIGCNACFGATCGYSVDQIADAIYIAEGGSKTSHPYGILAHYKTTTPRQACINTINHRLKLWNGQGDFIQYLSFTYCPIGASNDPKGLNKNWVRNVKYFLNKGIDD